ncbi:MAG TPA: pyridoxamine 5'-phosphate oxidase family protein [Acidobacteriaceae bacterium]|nr:pyridoxamine 5'-phosphate oxidase family protein [Acidobacteriaceae bacterium]
MGRAYAKVMFSEAAKRLQEQHGSRAQYERLAERGESGDGLGPMERDFIARRDSFYIASVTEEGWPYMQHRGGPKGFLRVLEAKMLAFVDYAGNKQYITAGNLETNDRVALFLMDYPHEARLKVIGHARAVEGDTELEARVKLEGDNAKVERVVVIEVVAFDWNCSQHITPRWTEEEIARLSPTE